MMKKIRFAVIGCGRIGERHALHINRYGHLSAVCDVYEPRARLLAGKYGAACYLSVEELLTSSAQIDVAVICTPNALHAQHTISCLDKGLHVLVEKPMAISSADCLAMIRASENAGKHIFTVMQNRFNPPVMAVKDALAKNMFGQLYSFQLSCFWNRTAAYYSDSWKGTLEMDGGTLFTQFSHFIDMIYWLFGNVIKIQAVTRNSGHQGVIEFEDNGVVLVECENGMIGTVNFSVNSFGKNREGSLTVLGEKGAVKIGGEYLNTIEYQQFENGSLDVENRPVMANDYGTYQGSMSNHDKVYENLRDALLQGAPYYASAFEGMKTVELIERIYRAAEINNLRRNMPFELTRTVIRDVTTGHNVRIIEPCNLYECKIGDDSFIGPFVEIQRGVSIGDRCKIQSHSFICEKVSIGNDCFIGHGVVFINDDFSNGGPAGDSKLWKPTHIGNHVSIGSNATILPVTICDNAVIGAGSVVTKNISEPGKYAGNPAKKIG